MDRFGVAQPLQVYPVERSGAWVYPVERSGAWVYDEGRMQVALAPATANTVPGFPDAYFIGGAPALVLEPLPSDYQPFAPTYANLPSPGLP